ncbi:MAG: NAD(P)H-hydrate epimerase [Actinomycetaceae bacterium]|nr:NAD(P)H-hydrate epimerase [Actinomycetaceae bacterium]MDY6082871.1 NAD(P)H-hydrate epimerase [Actinomycetaceae bacterium]
MKAYRVADIRSAEQVLLDAGEPLMMRASQGIASVIVRRLKQAGSPGHALYGRRILVLAGGGNNGGDALFAGAILARRGMQVDVLEAVPEHTHPEGLLAARRAGARIYRAPQDARSVTSLVEDLAVHADVWIDGLVGIGARGALRSNAATVVDALAECRRRGEVLPLAVAVDVPSGVDSDDGSVSGPAFQADVTVTMGASKPGLHLQPGRDYAGDVELVPLGYDAYLPDEPALVEPEPAQLASLLRLPDAHDHKYSRGVVGVMTGSERYPGAGILSVAGARAAGAGMVRYAAPHALSRIVVERFPDVVATAGRVQAWVIGSGIDMEGYAGQEAARRLQEALAEDQPVVLDAGALVLAQGADLSENIVLTPHAGEMTQLLASVGETLSREDVENAPARAARLAATATGATVMLKGSVDYICGSTGPLFVVGGAPAWRGTAGAGDVLAGLVGGLLARWASSRLGGGEHPDVSVAQVAALATALHGRAAAYASQTCGASNCPVPHKRAQRAVPGHPITALDVASSIPAAFDSLVQ